MTDFKKVLIAVDTFGEYESVVKRALSVTDKESELSLIYVHEPIYFGEPYYPGSINFEEQTRDHAQKVIADIAEKIGVPPERQYLEIGRPASVIQDKAESIGADLIVLGTHGRHGLQRVLGSTANAVLHGVKCDVLAVRVPGETIDA